MWKQGRLRYYSTYIKEGDLCCNLSLSVIYICMYISLFERLEDLNITLHAVWVLQTHITHPHDISPHMVKHTVNIIRSRDVLTPGGVVIKYPGSLDMSGKRLPKIRGCVGYAAFQIP